MNPDPNSMTGIMPEGVTLIDTNPVWVPHVSPPQRDTIDNLRVSFLRILPSSPWQVTIEHDHIKLILDIPAVRHEDLNVQIIAGTISVTGKRFDNGFTVLQTYILGNDYDVTSTVAVLELGTLKLTIMKLANKLAHKVSVIAK